MAKRFLVAKGYTVLNAYDGEEGFEMFLHHQKQIAVVLTDLGLPKFGGDEVFKRIKAIDPKAKVILASGFIDPEVKAEMQNIGVKWFIQKPYSHSDILHTIRGAIDWSE
jgi:two-component system, cell cycle sensor histidine kinase and response regulator CckA